PVPWRGSERLLNALNRNARVHHNLVRPGSAPFGSGLFPSDQTVNKCSILLEAKGPSLSRLGFPYPKFPGNTGRVTPWPFIPPSLIRKDGREYRRGQGQGWHGDRL